MGKMKATATDIVTADAALILFGLDEARKPHAAWFKAADAELAERAAGLMRMRALRVVTDEHRAVALELAAGRIFESGRGFVPFVKAAAYERLSAFDDAFDPPAPVIEEAAPTDPVPPVTSVPHRWEDIDVGSLVLASTGHMEGFFEAVVSEAKGEALFVLRWRDWPEEPSIVRNGDGLARLIHEAVRERLTGVA